MGQVRFLNNVTLMAQYGNDAEIFTDPYPLNGLNYADVRANIEVLDGTGGTPTVDVFAQASNDGGATYQDFANLNQTGLTAAGVFATEATAGFATIRFKIALRCLAGSPGDLAWTTLDIHVNFTQR